MMPLEMIFEMHYRRIRTAILSSVLMLASAANAVAADETRAHSDTVAATVNGHPIPMADVMAMLQRDPSIVNPIIDQMINDSLIEQEAARRHVTATAEEIAGRKERLAELNPRFTLNDLLLRHNETMADLEHDIRIWIETVKLLTPDAKPPAIVRIRHILIRVMPADQSAPPGETPHTDAEALAIMQKAQGGWKSGREFGDLAQEYSEDPGTRTNGGDLGMLYEGGPFDTNILAAAMTLTEPGQALAAPLKSAAGYDWLQAISTSKNHPKSQDAMYANAAMEARAVAVTDAQIQAYIKDLRDKASIVNHYTGK